MAVEPKTKSDQEKMGDRAQQAGAGRPDIPRGRPTRRAAQTIISGMGELHLEILVDRMMREFNVEANVGKPQVAYREAGQRPASRHCASGLDPANAPGLRLSTSR